MTDCNWTEKVSLLIDGELDAVEARAVQTHLGDCFACRLAREDFLLLRHQLSSYRPEVNLLAQRRALDAILGAGDSARPAVASRDWREGDWRERAARLFALPRLGPALVAASALVLVCLAAAFLMFRTGPSGELAREPRPGVTAPTPGVGRPGAKDGAPAPTPDDEVAKIKPKGAGSVGTGRSQPGATELAKGVKPKGANSTNLTDRARANDSGGAAQMARAAGGGDDDLPLIIPPRFPFGSAAAADDAAADVASADVAAVASEPRAEAPAAGLSPARHAEQAEQLLRSFRNAEAGDTSDIAYERGRSQELLYQNIVLRREAASRGNVAVESVLGSLEPILTDIANLPDKPAREDVRSINERMRKKDIVAMLQIAARD